MMFSIKCLVIKHTHVLGRQDRQFLQPFLSDLFNVLRPALFENLDHKSANLTLQETDSEKEKTFSNFCVLRCNFGEQISLLNR